MNFLKTFVASIFVAAIANAHAAQVTLKYESEDEAEPDIEVVYDFETLLVDAQGNITIHGAVYVDGELPGFPGGITCGENTRLEGNQCIGEAPASSSSSSSVSSSSVSSSSSSPSIGQCGALPNNVTLSNEITLGASSGRQTISLPKNGIIAMPVSTGSNPAFQGSITLAGTVGMTGIAREIWISECPGGEPLVDPIIQSTASCLASGTTERVLNITQGAIRNRCNLALDTDYYINVRNAVGACPGLSCGAYIQHTPVGSL